MGMRIDEGRNSARGASATVELRIRSATLADAAAIAALSTALGYPSSQDEVERRLDLIRCDASHAVLVAVQANQQIAGWVHVCVSNRVESDPEGEIGGLVVDEQHRGSGVGRGLMERAEQWARARGLPSVYLRSNIIRQGAHAFYAHLGYEIVKTQHAFRKFI